MKSLNHPKRVLALDVHPRSFGYVVFEGSRQLLDWGVRSYRKTDRFPGSSVRRKLGALLSDFLPSVIVLRAFETSAVKMNVKRTRIFVAIQKDARSRRIPVRLIRHQGVKKVFGNQRRMTKHQMATLLAELLPDLAWNLPLKRKPWESEDYRMSIFDAAALGVVYFARQAKHRRTSATDPAPP